MKRAVQRVVRGEDGRIRSIYIDLETFQEVTNLEGYQVITGNTISNPEPVPSVEEPNTEPTGEIPEEPGYSSRGDRESNQYSNPNANTTSPSSARPSSNQGAPVGPVTRAGPVGPATPAGNLTRNPYEGQRDSAGATATATPDTVNPNSGNNNGRGLANLTGPEASAPRTDAPAYGSIQNNSPHRNDGTVGYGLTDDARTGMAAMASQSPSGIGINSAYRDPATNNAVSGRRNSEHLRGNAFDVSLKGMTDAEKTKAVADARYAGANRIGSYKGDTAIHVDFNDNYTDPATGQPTDPRARDYSTDVHPMYEMSVGNMSRAKSWFTDGLSDSALRHPNPTEAPRNQTTGFVSQDERVQDGTPTSAPSIYDAQQEQISGFGGTDVTGGSIFDSIGPTTANTPAALAAQGVRTRTPAEKTAIGKTLAGEMDRNTLDALAAGEQWAQQEFANMVTTIENRSTSKMFSTLGEALNPTHYNSLMASNLVTTEDNYQKYKGFIDPALDSFYAGGLIPTSWDYTSYFNPDLVSPKWATDLREPEQVGALIFGSLPEYSANTAFRSSYALNSNPRPDNPAPGTDTDTGLGGMMGGNTPGGRRDSGSGGSGGYQSRGIANSVGGTSSIDNSPDDRDSGYSGSANGGRSSGSSGGFAGNSGGTPGSSPGGGWSSQSSGGSKSTSSGSKSSGTPGSSPGGGWGSQGKSTQSAHAAERERDDSL